MYVCALQVCNPHSGQKRASDPQYRITDGCELPCGCWELNPGPLEEQLVILTIEQSLQPQGPRFLLLLFVFVFVTGFLFVALICPGTSSVDQAGLKLTEICLCLPVCWD